MPLPQRKPSILTSRVVRPMGQPVRMPFRASAVPSMSLKKGPTAITSKFAGSPVRNPVISGDASSGGMGNLLKNATTGALVGTAAKLGYDALTKKTPVTPKTPTPVGPTNVLKKPPTKTGTTTSPVKPQTPLKPTPLKPVPPITETKEPPVEEPPVEEPPIEETPVEETPVEETPVEETYFDETPVDDYVPDETIAEDDWSSWRKGGLVAMMKRGGIAHLADGGLPEDAIEMNDYPGVYVSYGSDGPVFMDSDGNVVDDPSAADTSVGEVDEEFLADVNEPDYETDTTGEPTTYVGDDGSTYTTNPDGSVTSTPATDWTQGTSNFLPDDLMNTIKGALPAAGAGALLAALLGSDFGGGGRQNQGVDMAQLAALNPRTTDFGIGPARFVNYDEYGSQDQMPDLYSNQLYGDLGTPAPIDMYVNQPVDDYSNIQPDNDRGIGFAEFTKNGQDAPWLNQDVSFADGGEVEGYYSYGTPVDPFQTMRVQAMKQGGLPAYSRVPVSNGRLDFRQGSAVHGPGDGQSDDIPAMLADGEYVFDADTVAALGNGSTKAGAAALDKMRENIRAHKRSAPVHKIPPPAKSPLAYLKGIK